MASSTLDDLTLLQWFIAGDASLNSNRNIRVQPTGHLRQLFHRTGALLATAYDQAFPQKVAVRGRTAYTKVIHQILLDHEFVPISGLDDDGHIQYEHHPIPQGMAIHCEPARNLWKRWWRDRHRLSRPQLAAQMMTLTKQRWRPIQDISLNRGTLYISADDRETVHRGQDQVVWLEPTVEDTTVAWSAASPAPHPPQGCHPDFCRIQDGRIFIKTPIGEVEISGDNIVCQSCLKRQCSENQASPVTDRASTQIRGQMPPGVISA